MRLNALEIDSKSADGRTSATASLAPAHLPHHSHRSQRSIHNVVSQAVRFLQIELQPLAEKTRSCWLAPARFSSFFFAVE